MKKLSLVLLLILIVIGPIIVPGIPVKAATGGYGTVNLAKGKTVTPLTNTVRGKPGDVNDGNIDSVWYSYVSNYGGNSNANSFVLDLGSAYSIGKIDIFPAQVHGFTINTSNDNSTWTERYKSPWANTSVNAPISVTPDGAFSARYIKYWGYANWSQYVGVLEINVYEWLTSPPPSPSGANGSTNLALNKAVTNLLGSVIQSNPPAYAVDGNPATFWASSQSGRDDGTGKWANYGQIKIDLGAKYTIGKVVISPQRVHDFRIVMADTDPAPAGSPWVFMSYPELFGSAKTFGEPYTFSLNGSVTARYITLTTGIWGTPSSLQPAIAEIEVYEWVAGTGATPASPAPVPATTQSKGPVGYWPGEGNANDAAGSRNGILRNGVTFAPGKVGQAFSLDGVSGYVDLGAWTTGSQWTLAAWVKPSSAPTGRKTMVGALADFYDWGIIMDEGKFGVATRPLAAPPWIVSSGIPATAGTWYYVAGTSDGTTAKIYINGELKGSVPVSPNYQGTSAGLRIGSEVWCNCNNFPGLVDEVRIYNYAQTQSEIQTDMNKTSGATPVGYWPGEGNANDAAGSRNGTLRNGVTFAPGKVGQAFNLDGVSGYVDLGAWTTGSQWTLAAWVKPSSAPTGRKTMVGALADFYDWGIVMNEGKLGVATRPLAAPPWIVSSGIPATAGTWYYVAGTSDGATAKIYINGELKGSVPVSPNYQGTSAGLRIGSEVWCNCNNFPGLVDEVRIYNYAQTQSEIQTDMNKASGATPTPAAPAITTPAPATRPTDTTLLAEERTVSPNDKITVPIRLEKADRLGSLNFSLRYDPSVLKVNKADSGDLVGGTLFQANIRDAGIIRFGIVAQGTTGITGDGPVAHVEFTALGARGAQSQLTLGDLMATDTSGARLGVTLRAGRVTIAAKLKGDYDGDGKVTAKDSLAALKMSVGELPEDLNLDMDADGKVTAEDARRILTGALSGAPTPTATQPTQPSQPTASLPATAATPATTTPALPPWFPKPWSPLLLPNWFLTRMRWALLSLGVHLRADRQQVLARRQICQLAHSKALPNWRPMISL